MTKIGLIVGTVSKITAEYVCVIRFLQNLQKKCTKIERNTHDQNACSLYFFPKN